MTVLYVALAVIAALINYIPLNANGGHYSPGYSDDIGNLIAHAGIFMMLFYAASAVAADGVLVWLFTRARRSA